MFVGADSYNKSTGLAGAVPQHQPAGDPAVTNQARFKRRASTESTHSWIRPTDSDPHANLTGREAFQLTAQIFIFEFVATFIFMTILTLSAGYAAPTASNPQGSVFAPFLTGPLVVAILIRMFFRWSLSFFNPTLAFAWCCKEFFVRVSNEWNALGGLLSALCRELFAYWAGQFAGGVAGTAFVYHALFRRFEDQLHGEYEIKGSINNNYQNFQFDYRFLMGQLNLRGGYIVEDGIFLFEIVAAFLFSMFVLKPFDFSRKKDKILHAADEEQVALTGATTAAAGLENAKYKSLVSPYVNRIGEDQSPAELADGAELALRAGASLFLLILVIPGACFVNAVIPFSFAYGISYDCTEVRRAFVNLYEGSAQLAGSTDMSAVEKCMEEMNRYGFVSKSCEDTIRNVSSNSKMAELAEQIKKDGEFLQDKDKMAPASGCGIQFANHTAGAYIGADFLGAFIFVFFDLLFIALRNCIMISSKKHAEKRVLKAHAKAQQQAQYEMQVGTADRRSSVGSQRMGGNF